MAAPPTPLPVACAAILDDSGRVLLAQRPAHKHLPLKWEFPGGKIEPGEGAADALVREIQEELGCTIATLAALTRSVHQYESFSIELQAFVCRLEESGEPPTPHEHAALAWVEPRMLPDYDLAPADLPVADALRQHLGVA